VSCADDRSIRARQEISARCCGANCAIKIFLQISLAARDRSRARVFAIRLRCQDEGRILQDASITMLVENAKTDIKMTRIFSGCFDN
jgi:hypothetical protein